MENTEVVLVDIPGIELFEIPVSYTIINSYESEKTFRINCEIKLSDHDLPTWMRATSFSFYFSRNNQGDNYKFIFPLQSDNYNTNYQLILDVISEYIVIRKFPVNTSTKLK